MSALWSAEQVLILGSVVTATGLALGVGQFDAAARLRRKMVRVFAHAQKVGAASVGDGGRVNIEGKVVGIKGRSLKAPLSERRCVWARVEARDTSATWRGRLRLVAEEVVCAPFLLDDGSGERIFVDPTDASVLVEDDGVDESGTVDAGDVREAAFLARHLVSSEDFVGTQKDFNMREQAICTKSTIRIVGLVRRVSASPATHDCELAMSATDDAPLFLTNVPNNAFARSERGWGIAKWLLPLGLLLFATGGLMAVFARD